MIGTMLGGGSGRHDRVLKLLDRERAILLHGPIGELGAVVERRESLLAELLAGDGELPDGFMTALKAKAERNSRLLLASLAGLRAARDQIESVEQAHRSLRTYTARGAAVEVAGQASTRDQRR